MAGTTGSNDGQSSQARVFAWTVPRSASTVFMKSLSSNGDVKAYLEPYATAEHFGPEGRLKPANQLPAEPTYTVEAVKKWLETDTTDKNIFVKELAYAVDGRYDVIPDGFTHSILIRKPVGVYKSYYRLISRMEGDSIQNLKDWLPSSETNIYKALCDLADHIETRLNQELVVIDSEDIMKSPADMIKQYCESVGLRYTDGLLRWKEGLPGPETWSVADSIREAEDSYQWMSNATNSTGWGVGIKKPPSAAEEEPLPQIVLDMIEAAEPYYEQLRNHPKRLLPSA